MLWSEIYVWKTSKTHTLDSKKTVYEADQIITSLKFDVCKYCRLSATTCINGGTFNYEAFEGPEYQKKIAKKCTCRGPMKIF